jgi:EAL domain-containing protein (putative c-di-GMP-specific phosphodiesterase class I)
VEALIRWHHPRHGLVQPDAFIPLLEETKMIVEVGRWVLREACTRAVEWGLAERGMYVSVNVSARQLDDANFPRDVEAILRETGAKPEMVVLEVTETAIMRDAAATALHLAEIKRLGVSLAIDDFGTGYSSLGYLRQFPLDILKIDRSFVASMTDSKESAALLRTLVQLGKHLGLKTLAEGVEQYEQFCQLQDEECDSAQGYMFARPLSIAAVEDFLANVANQTDTDHWRGRR